MWRQSHKYCSVDTELGEYDSSPLSPRSKLVYKQWIMDKKDELLVDGYYRECNITSHPMPYDVRQVITSYYLKKYSKRRLKRKIQERERRRKQRIKTILKYFLIISIVGLVLLSPDISGIIIVNINNCNLAIDDGGSSNISINLGVNEYLSIGSIIHIIFVVLLSILYYIASQFILYDNKTILFHISIRIECLLYLFIITWTIVGSILYSKMDQSTPSNQQCSDMVISWVVIKLIFYIACIRPFFEDKLFDFVSRIEQFLWMVIILIIPDIVALVINGINECDDGSNEGILGITEWLLIGSISHILISIIQCLICVVLRFGIVRDTKCEVRVLQLVPVSCSGICFVVWCIIGIIIISETNSENKQCKNMVISWIVIRFVEWCFLILITRLFPGRWS